MARLRNLMGGGRGRGLIALLGLALLVGAAAPAPAETLLRGLDGAELGTADLESGVVVLVFWASWSPRCRDVVERVNEIVERWPRAKVMTVNFQEDEPEIREFLRGQRLEAKVLLDADAAFSKRHAVTHLPGLLVFDEGERVFNGRLPTDANAVIERSLG